MNWVKTFFKLLTVYFCLFEMFLGNLWICKYIHYMICETTKCNLHKSFIFHFTKKPTDGQFFLLAANGSFWNTSQNQINVYYTSFFLNLLPNLLPNKTKDLIQLQVPFFIPKIDVVSLVKLNICQFLAFIFHKAFFLFVSEWNLL